MSTLPGECPCPQGKSRCLVEDPICDTLRIVYILPLIQEAPVEFDLSPEQQAKRAALSREEKIRRQTGRRDVRQRRLREPCRR